MLDQYLRAGLHAEIDAVLHAAKRWRLNPSRSREQRLTETIDALAEAYTEWNEAVSTFTQPDDAPPGELKHGVIVPGR
jgi:hypothetical protein